MIPTKAILFLVGCSEVNSTWLIISEIANQRARKVQFTCVVYINNLYKVPIRGYILHNYTDQKYIDLGQPESVAPWPGCSVPHHFD